jgi:hypothetical protein
MQRLAQIFFPRGLYAARRFDALVVSLGLESEAECKRCIKSRAIFGPLGLKIDLPFPQLQESQGTSVIAG